MRVDKNKFNVNAVFVALLLILFLVLGVNGCPEKVVQEQTKELSAPSVEAIDFEKLPQFETEVYEDVGSFTLFSRDCVQVINSGDAEDKIDMVFLAEGYKDLGKFEQDVRRYIDVNEENNGILGVEPFKSNSDKFNFYFVDQARDLGCKLGCFGLDRLVCCDDDKVKQVASQCPYDEVMVLVDTKKFCGASKDYATVCTIEDPRAELVLVHELGHSLGGLGDEYDYGVEGFYDVANCDTSSYCEKWSGVEGTDCFEGCGYTNLFRPTDKDSLMNIYIPKFGPVATNTFLGILSSYESGELKEEMLAAIQLDRSYVVSLSFVEGEILLDNLYVTNATFEEVSDGEYVGKIKSFEGELLSSFNMDLPKRWYYDALEEREESSSLTPDAFSYTFNAPYFSNGELLEVYDSQGEKLDEISLAPFAEVCGDGVCEEHEDSLSCSNDCPLTEKDGVCLPYVDGVCDADCPYFGKAVDVDCRDKQLINLLIAVVVLAIAFLATLLLKRFLEK